MLARLVCPPSHPHPPAIFLLERRGARLQGLAADHVVEETIARGLSGRGDAAHRRAGDAVQRRTQPRRAVDRRHRAEAAVQARATVPDLLQVARERLTGAAEPERRADEVGLGLHLDGIADHRGVVAEQRTPVCCAGPGPTSRHRWQSAPSRPGWSGCSNSIAPFLRSGRCLARRAGPPGQWRCWHRPAARRWRPA